MCYDRGGAQPTVTDANLVLGYLNPDALVGGELALNAGKARDVIATLGQCAGLDATDTAYGIHLIVNATMLRALRGVSSERGQDPSRFALLAIGGNGPVHAATLAESAGMTHIVVPPVAGLFSALGMLFADVEHQLAKGFYRRIGPDAAQEINAGAASLVEAGRKLLAEEGYARSDQQRVSVCIDLQYKGQTSPLTIPLAAYPATADTVAALSLAFENEHRRAFGYVTGEALQIVALKAICQGIAAYPRAPERVVHGNERIARAKDRLAYFGAGHGWRQTPVIARAALEPGPRSGPLIVEEYDTTVVVRPGWTARLDPWNNLHLNQT